MLTVEELIEILKKYDKSAVVYVGDIFGMYPRETPTSDKLTPATLIFNREIDGQKRIEIL